jgi:DNA-damage-inducible protein J
MRKREQAMLKTSNISARIDPELKNSVDRIFHELGLTAAQAITIFYRQVELQQGLPFTVKLPQPNEDTIRAINEAKNRDQLTQFSSADELFDDLKI